MTHLDSMLRSRDITLPTKDQTVKAMVFPVVMYGCESWTIKKAECEVKVAQLCPCSLQSYGLYSPWNSPGQNIGVGSLSLLHGSSHPKDQTQVSHIEGRFFTS